LRHYIIFFCLPSSAFFLFSHAHIHIGISFQLLLTITLFEYHSSDIVTLILYSHYCCSKSRHSLPYLHTPFSALYSSLSLVWFPVSHVHFHAFIIAHIHCSIFIEFSLSRLSIFILLLFRFLPMVFIFRLFYLPVRLFIRFVFDIRSARHCRRPLQNCHYILCASLRHCLFIHISIYHCLLLHIVILHYYCSLIISHYYLHAFLHLHSMPSSVKPFDSCCLPPSIIVISLPIFMSFRSLRFSFISLPEHHIFILLPSVIIFLAYYLLPLPSSIIDYSFLLLSYSLFFPLYCHILNIES